MIKKPLQNNKQHYKMAKKAGIVGMGLLMTLSVISFGNPKQNLAQAHAKKVAAYDISQWQGYITNHQARKLKHEVSFIILRAQNGGSETDSKIHHNIRLMNKYHIPYGVYSYSLYRNSRQARAEAKMLYRRAPHAKFYINDAEMNYAHRHMNSATRAWADEIKKLTNKPAVLYSYLGFMEHFNHGTRKHYRGIWLADYSKRRPLTNFHYDLWQFTDNYYSRALKERLDASKRPKHSKPLTFWIGKKKAHTSINTDNQINAQPASQKTINHLQKTSNHIQEVQQVKQTQHVLHNTQHKIHRNKIHNSHHVIHELAKLPSNHYIEDEDKPNHIVLSNDPNYNHFKVSSQNGIYLYDLGGNKIKHIDYGEQVHVKRLASSDTRNYSVGSYHGKPVLFTSASNDLQRIDD